MALHIDDALVRRLVARQFPKWADLPIVPVMPGGRDNRTFRLGDNMLVRLPSASEYAAQVEKEQCWLPRLAPSLPLTIPTSLATGQPAEGYPWKWSVYRWLEGEPLANNADHCEVASSLAQFLTALQRIDPTGGPSAGPHNFYRGGPLTTYDEQSRQAMTALKDRIDADAATKVWETALASEWHGPPKWVHGDIAASNLLVNAGRLSAVIDFGQLGVGDVACDVAIAWAHFEGRSRDAFLESLSVDSGTSARARGWALWKALIVAAALVEATVSEQLQAITTIDQVLADLADRRTKTRGRVAVLLYPGCTYFEVEAAVNVLAQHREVLHFTPSGSALADATGKILDAQGSYADLERSEVDCVLVPGGDPGSIIPQQQATAALRRAANHGAVMAGICAGNLVLASAGLLKGVRATHNYTPEYASPVDVAATAPYWDGILFERADLVEDGNRITAQHWAHEKFAVAVARQLGLANHSEK
jgi:aminoglycoside phosphotransferase (APT) family kinase protein/putative intracellular protease/amidase